jgi:hypothetical protein
LESSQPTALRPELIIQAGSDPDLGSTQNAPAQVRWLRQDLASLTETVYRLAAARARIVALLGRTAMNGHVAGSATVELSPRGAPRPVHIGWSDAIQAPMFAEQPNFAPQLSVEGSEQATRHPTNPRPRPARTGLPIRYANGLVALGLTLVVVAISFTIA